MKNPNHHDRKPNRARGYDYATPGAYFVTACTHDRLPLFGQVVDGVVMLNEYGILVAEAWEDLPQHYPHVVLDAFVIMPNHVHGIIWIYRFFRDDVRTGLRPVPTGESVPTDGPVPTDMPTAALEFPLSDDPILRHGLPEIMRAFKSFSSRRINRLRNQPGRPVWQRSYWDRIIRDQAEFDRIHDYIRTNPGHWSDDSLHPAVPPNQSATESNR